MADSNLATPRVDAPEEPVPGVGTISLIGRRSSMEDAISINRGLCSPYLNRHRPIDFFAVYDGHGGSHVSGLCRDRMHLILKDELTTARTIVDLSSGSSRSDNIFRRTRERLESQMVEESWKKVLRKIFRKIDKIAFVTCYRCGIDTPCGCPPQTKRLGGSTAVLAILTEETIIVANCGDSRAVLSRGGTAIPLSTDHKPDRLDELARIMARGGRVDFGGCARVQGILGMSRAIGDKCLKRYITSEPEFTFIKREPEDECLILASNGLWDVVTCKTACEVAVRCLQEQNPDGNHSPRPLHEDDGRGAVLSSPSASAAALLAQLATERDSRDNISIIVVDLKTNNTRF